MRIETIRLKNFKSFQDAELTDLPSFCIVVGANGTGKSTLFDVFGFLKDCLAFNVTRALGNRGGFKEVASREKENEKIRIELQFRLKTNVADHFLTYILEIVSENGKPIVDHEILAEKDEVSGSPFHLLDFERGGGYAVTYADDTGLTMGEASKISQKMDRPDILALKGYGQFQRFRAANAVRNYLENRHISDFHINLARGSKDAAGYAEHLSVTGDNLQPVANHLFENHPDTFGEIKYIKNVDQMGYLWKQGFFQEADPK